MQLPLHPPPLDDVLDELDEDELEEDKLDEDELDEDDEELDELEDDDGQEIPSTSTVVGHAPPHGVRLSPDFSVKCMALHDASVTVYVAP